MLEVHQPVLLEEVISLFSGKENSSVLVDCTLGNAGHAYELANRFLAPDGVLVGFDQDEKILPIAAKRLEGLDRKTILINENFSCIREELLKKGIDKVDGVLMDIGVSSFQLDSQTRGFSFKYDAPLDMRMDIRNTKTAFDVINGYPEAELKRIFREYGEVRNPGRVSRVIAAAREKKMIRTTSELSSLLSSVLYSPKRRLKINPLTLIYQAIRIEVNDELEVLKKGLSDAFMLLKKGGILAVITFHSLEDRIVKQFFREREGVCRCPANLPECACGCVQEGVIINKKPLTGSEKEISLNSRARSAKLRGICRV